MLQMLVTKVDLLHQLTQMKKLLELIVESIEKSKLKPGKDISICLDVAANELIKKGEYSIQSNKYY